MRATMKAVGVCRALPADHPESLIDLEIPVPVPGPFDLLVRVEAISLNPTDYRSRYRKVDDGRAAVLGWDAAGTVVAVGQAVSTFRPGDTVYYAGDTTRPGANSEFHAVDSRIVAHRPRMLTATAAAAVPLTVLTAWEALYDRIGFLPDGTGRFKTLLIVGGAGGVGSIAIQLAKQIPGVRVIATASRPESQQWCRDLGADDVIDHFGAMPKQLADQGIPSVDAVLLANDPDRHFPALVDLLAPQGVICSIVPFARAVDMNLLMRKSASLVWEFMFTRPMFSTADMGRQGDILATVAGMIDDGTIRSAATRDLGRITAENLRAGHALLETGRTIGKLTLTGF